MTVEYWVVVERDPIALAASVNSYIAQKWRPQGGVVLDGNASSPDYCQAIVRDGTSPVWVVRGGEEGEYEQSAMDSDCIVVGWDRAGDLRDHRSEEEVQNALAARNNQTVDSEIRSGAENLWRLRHDVAAGDFVIMPFKGKDICAVGRVAGDYQFIADGKGRHRVPVIWWDKKVSKQRVGINLNPYRQTISPVRENLAAVAHGLATLMAGTAQ